MSLTLRGIFVMISSDQCRRVEGDLSDMFNVVRTCEIRAGGIKGDLENCLLSFTCFR